LTIEQKDQLPDLILFSHAIFDGFAGVQHRTVIAATERISNLVERSLGMTPRQIHRHLARKRDVRRTPLTGHVSQPNVKVLGNFPLDLVNGYRFLRFLLKNVAQQVFNRISRNLASAQGCERGNTHQGTLQPANVGPNPLCQKLKNVWRKLNV
jgi:hypothetical protein